MKYLLGKISILFAGVLLTTSIHAQDNYDNFITDQESSTFDGGSKGLWAFVNGNDNGGYATLSVQYPGYGGKGYCLLLKNSSAASDNWKAQARYEFSPALKVGKYRLEFYAKASANMKLEFGYQKNAYQDGEKTGIYFDITTEWTKQTLDFDMTLSDVARMFFNFGKFNGSINLDNIRLLDMNPPVEEPNVTGNLITDNASYNFNDATTGLWTIPAGYDNSSMAKADASVPGYGKSAACLHLSNSQRNTDNSKARIELKLPTPLEKGNYKLEFYAKASASCSNLEFGYRNDDTAKGNIAGMKFKLTTDWSKKSVKFETAFDNAGYLYFCFADGTSDIYLDRIVLKPVATPAPDSTGVLPYYYPVEEECAGLPVPLLPDVSKLTSYRMLPDPYVYSDGKDTVTSFSDWARRRYEISQEIQKYEIGTKPTVAPEQISASMSGNTLKVVVTVGSNSITLTSTISVPKSASTPCPLMIGTSMNSLPASFFSENGIATMTFSEAQVNNYSQMGGSAGRGNYNFDKLYPKLKSNGAYAEWSWGVSRLIDGLYLLGEDETGIDLSHIGVTGCSYAGKMALFAGAMDERICLTIAQEPGGGGAAAWRVSEGMNDVEKLGATDGNWFLEGFQNNFSGNNCYKLPYDHHELIAMCCPRAVLILGNPDYTWLADESGYVSSVAALEVWKRFGIEDRMGYSFIGGHDHCSLPSTQYTEVRNFIKRFLLDDTDVDTKVRIAPKFKNTDAEKWFSSWSDGTWTGIGTKPIITNELTVNCNGTMATARFTIESECNVEFIICDLAGTIIGRTIRRHYGAGSYSTQICQLPGKGTFICTMNDGSQTHTTKFVVN